MPAPLDHALSVWEASPCEKSALGVLDSVSDALSCVSDATDSLHRFLDLSRLSTFLSALSGREQRYRCAELCLASMDASGYSIETMIEQRVARHPDRQLFVDRISSQPSGYTFSQVRTKIRQIAATLHSLVPQPRVAIVAENSLDSACVDLACLTYDILDTPISVHFDTPTMIHVLESLSINTVITNRDALHARMMDVKQRMNGDQRILRMDLPSDHPDSLYYGDVSRLTVGDVDRVLERRVRFGFSDPATVMFTSGSTGEAKGLVFSQRNLLSKRYARAAALPSVGEQEVLLCYLPLFHTFGRFLEMLGMVFWGGTYYFAGNPSAATLLALMQQVRPTGLISIPLRWSQVYEHCLERTSGVSCDESARRVFACETGGRLRWGLSAAGRLDPRVFRFFGKMGVELCSGFGMTEATGGITMTPPGEYRDRSVGIPLPLIRTRLSEVGELQISGPYVAKYLGEEGVEEPETWLRTGDLFVDQGDGHLEIVDRIKDIYKNTRGQTLAPGRVEQRFADVPGIKRVFLVGDGKDYNALLIIPDLADPVLVGYDMRFINDQDCPARQYFQQIVASANKDLAPYERVVNFAILDRDFSSDYGELTPKGTYNRKAILTHFSSTIQELYHRNAVELPVGNWLIRIPRWIYRDLTELESDIVVEQDSLLDKARGVRLTILPGSEQGYVRVGDLEYGIPKTTIDLGLLAKQPLLWAANPSLVSFVPCKDGWDVALDDVSARVLLPWELSQTGLGAREANGIELIPQSAELREVHRASTTAIFSRGAIATAALDVLIRMLDGTDVLIDTLVRRRLECLARHSEFAMRSGAYRALLFSRQVPDYDSMFRSFALANLSFLDESAIDAICKKRVERRRLGAFRQRLYKYRTQLPWPESDSAHSIFMDVFRLLSTMAHYHPENYGAVREELVTWAMHQSAPQLAAAAERTIHSLAAVFERSMEQELSNGSAWKGNVVFQEGLDPSDVERLRHAIVHTNFLKQAIMLTTDGEICELSRILPDGIWVSSISSLHRQASYRVSITTDSGKHYDLQMVIPHDIDKRRVMRTVFWLVSIRGYPFGRPVLPRFGCWREELGVMALAFVSDLNVWERVRAYASIRTRGAENPLVDVLRKLFVRSMAAFFSAWLASGRRIVPGVVSPSNVVVPDPDFREGTQILSVLDYSDYDGPKSIVEPLVRNFYVQTARHYPWCGKQLDPAWIFHACIEALGETEGLAFLRDVEKTIGSENIGGTNSTWSERLSPFFESLRSHPYVPLAISGAIERYRNWERINSGATCAAREQSLLAVQRLYGFDRFPEWTRYYLFAQTYFEHASREIRDAFSRLVTEMARYPDRSATSHVEVSDLQGMLETEEDRGVFGRVVFPRMQPKQHIDLLSVRHGNMQEIIMRSEVRDVASVAYSVREPLEPAEVGKLYRLYVTAGFIKSITSQDMFLVLLDESEQVVGGLSHQMMDEGVVNLDGIVISRYLRGRGLNTALLEDFCARMANQGARVIKTQFFATHFYMRRGFRVDRRFGGLVRFLREEPQTVAASLLPPEYDP